MNLIWICADTFRNDHLGCLGRKAVQTPRLDQLAASGALFENAYCEGLPTGPERTTFMTGHFTLPFRGWDPLLPSDITLAEHLGKLGYRTALMCDCPHFFKPNCNYHRGFQEFRWIRGQEADAYATGGRGRDVWDCLPRNTREIPLKHKKNGARGYEHFADPLRQYLRNTAGRGEDESEFFAAQTCASADRWLRDNRDADRFLLWIELFDPHEPWDPPQKYANLYRDPKFDDHPNLSPWFHSLVAADYSPAQLEDLRALYAAEVSFVDACVGRLLDTVDEIGLRGETVIVFTSDHGTMLGERGAITKDPNLVNTASQWVCNQPLIIRHPGGPAGLRVADLVWSPDYMPTCCDMLGEAPPAGVHGRSFWPLLREGDASAARTHIVCGYRARGWYAVDDEWRYLEPGPNNAEELYRRATDPFEERNVAADNPAVCRRMAGLIAAHRALPETLTV